MEGEEIVAANGVVEGLHAEFGGLLLGRQDALVADDRLGVVETLRLARPRRRFVKFELAGADFEDAAVDQACFVDFLVVDERAVAAAGVADPPGVVLVQHDGVDARRERVGEDNVAIQSAADAVLLAGVEREAGSRPVASRHVEILVHACRFCRSGIVEADNSLAFTIIWDAQVGDSPSNAELSEITCRA
jgi:hypothetical protein